MVPCNKKFMVVITEDYIEKNLKSVKQLTFVAGPMSGTVFLSMRESGWDLFLEMMESSGKTSYMLSMLQKRRFNV